MRCYDGSCISDLWICDGVNDCQFGEDEHGCGCNNTFISDTSLQRANSENQCQTLNRKCQLECHSLSFICANEKCIHFTFVCDGIKDCKSGADEICDYIADDNRSTKDDIFACSDGRIISRKYVDDLIPDCDNATDEQRYVNAMHTERLLKFRCGDPSMLPCQSGTANCFYRHELCDYDRDKNDMLKVCRNGAHLEECENFQCPQRYKCQLSYCIPYRRLCDGTVDCLHADDEESCEAYTCSGMLHCRDHKFCVHQSEVCDTHLNCPLGDDEANCILNSCPRNCFCFNAQITRDWIT